MRFGYTRDTTIRLVWALILVAATSGMLTSLALGLSGEEYPGLDLPRTQGEQFALGVGLVGLWVLFGTPFFTAHLVRAREVVLRQGVLFHARIPYEEIYSIAYGTSRPLGLGVRWYPDTLFVVTWPANLVEIRLKRRRVFRLLGFIPLPPVTTVTVNVDDADRFLAALRERMAAVQA